MAPRSSERLRAVASILRCWEVKRLDRFGTANIHWWIQAKTFPVPKMFGERAVPFRADEIQG